MNPDKKAPCYDYISLPSEVKGLLDKLLEVFKKVLQGNLMGIYLHGSLATGCFVPGKSDIDMIIVVREALSGKQKRELARACLALSREIGGKGLEISVISEKYAKSPAYPMPFEFHYSESWRSKFERGQIGPFPKGDPDLSAHLRVINERGTTLLGKPIPETFGPLSDEDYMKALLYDLENISELIDKHPVYYTLNLCRILGFIQTGKVMSKKEGGEWYLANQEAFRGLISKALKFYSLYSEPKFDLKELNEFVKATVDKINKAAPR